MLPDLHTDFSRIRSGGLVFPSLSEVSTVCCDPHSQRLSHREIQMLPVYKMLLVNSVNFIGCEMFCFLLLFFNALWEMCLEIFSDEMICLGFALAHLMEESEAYTWSVGGFWSIVQYSLLSYILKFFHNKKFFKLTLPKTLSRPAFLFSVRQRVFTNVQYYTHV